MKRAYLIVGSAIILLGSYYVVDGLLQPANFLNFFGITFGFLLVLVGILNLLNLSYGSTAPGVRFTSIGVNVAMVVWIIWVGVAFPSDLEELLPLVDRLAADPELRRSLGEKARKEISSQFSEERWIEQYFEFIQIYSKKSRKSGQTRLSNQ